MFFLPWSWRRKQALPRPLRGPRPQLEALEERLQPSIVAVSANDAKINTSGPLGQTLPSVTRDANGDFVVAWSDQTHLGPSYEYNVDARVYNKAGQAQTGEIVVAQTIGEPRPSVAMDANGDFVVSWQVLNSSTYLYGVSAQRYNLAGSPQGSTLTLASGSSGTTMGESPKVAMDSSGDFTIAFQGYDSNLLGIFVQRFNSSGVAQGAIFPVNAVTTGNQSGPTIAMDSAGEFVIAWQDGGQAQNAGMPSGTTPQARLKEAIPPSALSPVAALPAIPRSPWSQLVNTLLPGNSRKLLPVPVKASKASRPSALAPAGWRYRAWSNSTPREITTRATPRSRSTARVTSSWRGQATAKAALRRRSTPSLLREAIRGVPSSGPRNSRRLRRPATISASQLLPAIRMATR